MDVILTPAEKMGAALAKINARAEIAEADAAECRAERAAYGDNVAAALGALENEVEQVNRRFENLSASTSAMLVNAEKEIELLRELNADRNNDLRHEYYRANTAEAEVERLRAQVVSMREDVALMLRTPHNHDWLPSDDCIRCEIEQRLAANSQDAW